MRTRALLLALTVGLALVPGVARAHHGRHQGSHHGRVVIVHSAPGFVAPVRPFFARPQPVFVAPFRVHPRGFRHFAFVPVAPFPGAVFVGPFWWWNGVTWVWVPGHWGW